MLLSPRPRIPNLRTSVSICCCQDHLNDFAATQSRSFTSRPTLSPQPLERFPTFGRVHHNMLLSRSQGSIVTAVAIPWSQIDLHNGGLKWGTGALGFVVQLVKITCPRPRGWMRLRELMQHSTVGHGSGRVRSICCYDHAVYYVCVVNAIPFLCCGVGYKYSNNIIITTFNKTCGM